MILNDIAKSLQDAGWKRHNAKIGRATFSHSECADAAAEFNRLATVHALMLAALRDVRDGGAYVCCCERPHGVCVGSCTATIVEQAIAAAEAMP